jgi:hypothetical protein
MGDHFLQAAVGLDDESAHSVRSFCDDGSEYL